MTSSQIRQSFLDFFREKLHTTVPSASLLPQSPGLLFTNAGMNQFVPYFLGTENAPYSPPRAADTQKCIRAGGKHNDLEDVGYDTYHHTFFEMLGNWSFGDYFKKEAITWAWELVIERWGVPPQRLYASVYSPAPGDPSSFDQEAYDLWAALFISKGLNPATHIVNGNVKDNFWMMGETGPCGPCSELHVDLTPNGDSRGKLVNQDSDLCIEIWNLVFIQYNAEADGTFRDLPSQHVDTGMGFERACSIIQNTNGLTDFSKKPTNYATDVFQPLFRKLEELSGKTYSDIYPAPGADRAAFSEEMKTAVAFRVIADHLRTLSFSIADAILPGNTGRNYVLRRILRRAVRYGRQLGFSGEKPFFADLSAALVLQMGDTFPELKTRAEVIRTTLENEETSFNQTLDRGLKLFGEHTHPRASSPISGEVAFELYDTFGFPIDLTELLATERGLTVDKPRFEALMLEQQVRSRAAQKSSIVRALDISSDATTEFTGFEHDEIEATILEIHPQHESLYVITDRTVFYAEMGGQSGDTGVLVISGKEIPITGTQQIGKARAHIIPPTPLAPGDKITLRLDSTRRRLIEAHHTATHLLHWALHQVVSADATQQGSSVDEHRLRFDFNSPALTPEQLAAMEKMVNAAISANDSVSWTEVKHASIKHRTDIMQFFGDKYGDLVRVVQIGGVAHQLNGYSQELCGGTHVSNTSEIGLFKIKSEGAIASGVRRIEAVCGAAAHAWVAQLATVEAQDAILAQAKLDAANAKLTDLGGAKISTTSTTAADLKSAAIEAEKQIKKIQSAQAAKLADEALTDLIAKGEPIIASFSADSSLLQELQNGLKKRNFAAHALLIVDDGEKLHLAVHCGPDALAKGLKAGAILSDLAAIAGGKGGGKPDQARGAAPERDQLDAVIAAMRLIR